MATYLKMILVFSNVLLSNYGFSHGITEEAKKVLTEGGPLQYIWAGAEHMLTGYDHLLFLFGVMFFLTSAKDVVKFVTVFTLGHSITLIAATFLGISANYWLIDAVIALSVCYKGLENNGRLVRYLGLSKSPNLLVMVFGFGLIHGFGLSTRLQQLPLSTDNAELFWSIICFNVGVEFGQIAALLVILGLLILMRRANIFEKLAKIFNDLLVASGVLLLLMQLHGYVHTHDPDEFGFSKDHHIHHHEDMEEDENPIGHDTL